jgi:hypothetical protein
MADADAVTGMVLDPTGRGHALSLLIKRDSYDHEEEVRLIFAANRDDFDERQQAVYKFIVNPNALFDEAVLDPRLDVAQCSDTQARLRAWGFSSPITQSPINVRPNYVVDLNA